MQNSSTYQAVLRGSPRMGKYYAVRVGRRPGIYQDWSDVQPLVNGYHGAQHKSFTSRKEAEDYLSAGSAATVGRKRSRNDDDGYGAFGSHDDKVYLAQARRTEISSDHRNQHVPTLGILVVEAHGGSADGRDPPRTRPFAGSADNHSQRPTSGSGTRSPYDTVVEGPLQPIRSSSLYELEFDGAARGNPGQGGCGAVLRHNGTVVCRLRKYMGSHSTNNEAEYTALIEGLQMARRLGVTRLHAKGDSKLVVMQVMGKWNINKDHLRVLCEKVHDETRRLEKFEIRHIFREQNAEADKLSNEAIDLAYMV